MKQARVMSPIRTVWVLSVVTLISLGCKPERETPARLTRVSSEAQSHKARSARDVNKMGANLSVERRAVVLAEGRSIRITVGDFLDALNDLPIAHRTRYQNPDRWPELLNDLVAFELLTAIAVDGKLERDERVLYAFKKEVADLYLSRAAAKAVSPGDISAAEIKAAYEERPELSRSPALVKLWVYATDDPQDANDTLKFIEEMVEDTPLAIGRLRERIPINGVPDLGVGKTGDAGYVDASGTGKRDGVEVQMIPQIMASRVFQDPKPGRIVGIEHTKRGYQIVIIEDFRAEKKKPFDIVSPRITNLLVEERRAVAREKIAQDVRSQAKLVVDQAAFERAFGTKTKEKTAPNSAKTAASPVPKKKHKYKLLLRPGMKPMNVPRARDRRIRESLTKENPYLRGKK